MVKLIMEKGGYGDGKYNAGCRALFGACEGGHESVVKVLREKGTNVDGKNNKGDTALLKASQGGHESVVKLLLQKGANVDVKAIVGRSGWCLDGMEVRNRWWRCYWRREPR